MTNAVEIPRVTIDYVRIKKMVGKGVALAIKGS